MNNIIEQKLIKLKLKLKCERILFTIISILLSLLFAPICFLLLLLTMLIMFVVAAVYCFGIPFIVAYKCIKYEGSYCPDEVKE